MKKAIQQINLTRHMPIDIRVWNGSFELLTHPELSVKIDAGGITNMDIVPQLLYADDRIMIAHQSFSSILSNGHAIKVKLYMPDESMVRLHQLAGRLSVSGSYKSLGVKNWLGNVYARLDDLFVREEANLEVVSGDVCIDAADQSVIKSRSGDEHYQFFKFQDGSSIRARTHIGEVKWRPHHRKNVHYFA